MSCGAVVAGRERCLPTFACHRCHHNFDIPNPVQRDVALKISDVLCHRFHCNDAHRLPGSHQAVKPYIRADIPHYAFRLNRRMEEPLLVMLIAAEPASVIAGSADPFHSTQWALKHWQTALAGISLRGSRRALPKLEECGTAEKFMRVQISGTRFTNQVGRERLCCRNLACVRRNDIT